MKLNAIEGKANSNLYRHPTTQIIYFSLSKKGKGRIWKSTRTTNLADARRIADEIRFQFLGQRNPRHGRKLNKELFPEMLDQKRIKSPATFKRYELCGQHLKPFIEDMGPEEITDEWWSTVYIPAKRREDAGRKFFNDRKTLRMYLLALRKQGVIDRVPDLVNPDARSRTGRLFTDDEIERLLKVASPDLKLQVLMAVTMGMRRSEILLLPTNQVDRERRLITLHPENTKTRQGRTFAITDTVWALLEPRLDHPSGFVFPSRTGEAKPIDRGGNQTAWEGARRRAEVKGRFHDLRHTYLTRAFKTSHNPALICFSAGLSLEVAQKTYLHFTPEDTRDLARSMGEKWGK